MSSDPFSRFPRAEFARWRELAEAALAGADFDRSLRGKDSAGLITDPVYTEDSPGAQPVGEAARHRTTRAWHILQDLGAPDTGETRRVFEEAVEQGVDALDLSPLWLPAPWKSGQPDWRDADSLAALLGSLPIERLELWMDTRDALLPCAGMLRQALEQTGHEAGALRVRLLSDPYTALPLTGSVRGGWARVWQQANSLLQWGHRGLPAWHFFGADGQPWHEVGLGAAEELALVLASLHGQLRGLTALGADPAGVMHHFSTALACDREFFTTIAKFRALRVLIDQVLEGWGLPEESRRLPLRARTSWRELSLLDPWSNQLRLSNQLAAAACAGADCLCCGTWLDGISHWQHGMAALPARDRRLARRLARTTPALVRHEAFLERVDDPGGGSWFIENRTRMLAEAAWQKFQQIEEAGGLEQAWSTGLVATWHREAAEAEHKALAHGRRILVGVNRYVNLAAPSLPESTGTTGIPPLDDEEGEDCTSLEEAFERAASEDWRSLLPSLAGREEACGTALACTRVAEPFEALRRRAARLENAVLPMLRLDSDGSLRARSDFLTQFLAVGGISVEAHDAGNGESVAATLLAGRPPVLLLCAADAAYPGMLEGVLSLRDSLSPGTRLILAGHPRVLEPLLGTWADPAHRLEYIHLNGEQLDRLAGLLDELEGGPRG
ncbi:MAG: hypothetical protein H6678_12630 [Candidatus Delongbacteria bacterium]|nr:hypothetical protein [Candidatus Cloacimonadota bacterium]MCA9785357.1 hypothetical protein [Candidatus Cloacimonadota bacterium]MCB9474643.1 hypothetical protein [Candidatus Delongbacteria bacterium]